MKKRLLAFLTAFALLWLGVRMTSPRAGTAKAEAAFETNAKAAVLMEASTGRVLYAKNADERRPMASTTKIMTALLTLEQPGLQTQFIVDKQAIQVEGSSMGLREGDTVTLYALACGMLLPSGNDAAGAAAVRVAGSKDAFVEMMNSRAAELGMKNTHFATPSGLDSDGHFSTAYDMALLAREAMENEDFAAICKNSKMTVQFGNPPYTRWLSNHNRLLKSVEGAIGVKTGFTKSAGRCLVSCVERGGVRLIAVTLSCPDDWNEHSRLYDAFFPRVAAQETAGYLPQVSVPVIGALESSVTCEWQGPETIPVFDGEKVEAAVYAPPFVYAPVKCGQALGYGVLRTKSGDLCEMTLVSTQDAQLTEKERLGFFGWLKKLSKDGD